jgi:LAO/AO transport system kinase
VLLASAQRPESIAALSAEIDRHQAWLQGSPQRQAQLQARARYRLRRLVERRAARAVASLDAAMLEAPLADQVTRVLQAMAGDR